MTIDTDLAKKLWSAADALWTNSGLQPSEYSTPILALIFLKYADYKFAEVEKALEGKTSRRRDSQQRITSAVGIKKWAMMSRPFFVDLIYRTFVLLLFRLFPN